MKYETFVEKFKELSVSDKVSIFNAYQSEYSSGETIEDFDEEFFRTYFSEPMEAARATFFGSISSWSDEYISFDAYGNLQSFSKYNVEDEIESYISDIYDYEDVWGEYINDDDEEDDELEYICPVCGHVFEQGEWDYNYDTALLDFHCPECDWEGNENQLDSK